MHILRDGEVLFKDNLLLNTITYNTQYTDLKTHTGYKTVMSLTYSSPIAFCLGIVPL